MSARRPKFSRPPSLRDRARPKIAEPKQQPIDYSQFGPHGPDFQRLHEDTWRDVEAQWNALPTVFTEQHLKVARPPLREVLAKCFDRSGFLHAQIISAAALLPGHPHARALSDWASLAEIFCPPLRSHVQMERAPADYLLRRMLINEAHCPVRLRQQERRLTINNICHGPFTSDEMTYVLRRHPRLLEVGCGSGYFAAQFTKKGGDILAQDNNRYGLSRNGYPWTDELQERGKLVMTHDIARVVRDNADRALLISWPEPGSAFPSRCLEEYAQAGGQTLLLKLGGFIGLGRFLGNPDYVPPRNPGWNVAWFFRLLSEDWVEATDSDRPGWNPLALENNLLVFRRKRTNQQNP